ncbi:single-pass membrane and coiled-coil domain-containing protein 3-like [Amia ocellicauda]|uniref:single-pass membrane and coiled-coil domain-containing protein 3-like n=1 Tax=Amia ocellicauda TaxID=2972642 RepID=UPI003464DE92
MLIGTIGSIQAQVVQIDSRLKEKLEPEMYQKLYSLTVPLSDRIHIASRVLSGAFGMLGSRAMVAELIHKRAVLGRIVASLGRVGTCAVATVALGVLGLGVDMVASAILGAIERENLERVIQEYSEALEEFRPASEQYLENIGNVIARVQFKRGL